MALQVTKEPMEQRQLAVTIEVDQERVHNELRKAARKAAHDFRIPGFRKGKAPFSVIVQYVGLPALYDEFVGDLGQEVYKEALDNNEFEPYATATLEDVQIEPLRYKLIVPLEPEIDLGDYRSLRVPEETPEVSEEEIEERLREYTEQYAGWQEVDHPSAYGDVMTIDVRSVLLDTPAGEEETVVLDEQDWEFTPDPDHPMDPPGFDEELLGLRPGDDKEFVLSWPEDGQSIYAGKRAHFSVAVHSIQAYQSPEINDDLAQLVGPDFETLDDLKQSVRATLLEEKEQEAEAQYTDRVLDALLEQSTLNYPPVVVEDQIDAMLNEFEQQVRRIGFEDLDAYFEAINQDREEFRETQRPEATRIAERNLLISELINQEKLQATDEEIEARIQQMLGEVDEADEQASATAEMFRSGTGRSILESQILTEKALDRLQAIARGEEPPEPIAHTGHADTDAAETNEPDTAAGASALDTAEERTQSEL